MAEHPLLGHNLLCICSRLVPFRTSTLRLFALGLHLVDLFPLVWSHSLVVLGTGLRVIMIRMHTDWSSRSLGPQSRLCSQSLPCTGLERSYPSLSLMALLA